MAVEMFLDLDSVTGESQANGFQNKIDIFSYSLGVSNPTSVSTGSGSGAGKASFSSMVVQKTVDKSSTTLFSSCCKGAHLATGKLTVREAGGDSPVEYLVMEFTEVFIDSISWGGATGGDKPSESVSFSFKTIKIHYKIQDKTGKEQSGGDAGWDVSANTKY